MASVLIVGSSSGLGKALKNLYRAKGWEVDGLTREDCDLADPVSVERWADGLPAKRPAWDLCIFAAGTCEAGYADRVDANAYRRCLEVNFLSPLTLFYHLAVLPQPCRQFVFILSGAAALLVPGLGPYALSKRLMRDWLHLAKLEQSFKGCHFLEVWPGSLATDFNRKARVHGDYTLPQAKLRRDPKTVALKIYKAQQNRASRLVLSPEAVFAGAVQAACPSLADLLVKQDRRFHRSGVK